MVNGILPEITNHTGTITIDRPEKRNNLSVEALQEIARILEEWQDDDRVKVVIITGKGDKTFVSGADISELYNRTMNEALKPTMSNYYKIIDDYRKPTIAAINGAAIGGGLELALACDLRFAVKDVKLGLPEVGLGVMPGAGGTQRLSRIIGMGRALELILTGETITAEEGERIGLITKAVERDQLMPTVAQYAEKLSGKGPLALQLAKSAVKKGFDIEMETALLLEKYAQTILMGSNDKKEGMKAFLEKRKPLFSGK